MFRNVSKNKLADIQFQIWNDHSNHRPRVTIELWGPAAKIRPGRGPAAMVKIFAHFLNHHHIPYDGTVPSPGSGIAELIWVEDGSFCGIWGVSLVPIIAHQFLNSKYFSLAKRQV